ncbi:MBL fold metallo-hydrolase [Anoxybacillus rupiensis]|uniref:MBL fold metallo-hydrolase n=1 Tax=Anoxybacteroides rupiense TaxID=311460 RepID=UPI001BA4C5DD|nr:MBL fold metallo-hydrolase [Anoxybacillus rupiensis]MBS2770847.1 MBL fold metallo-hydrolase [Anoxybacillus rupiensis]
MLMVNIEIIQDHMYRIPVPVPFPMKYVYCYLFREADGWSIVDAGFHYPDAIDTWEKAFQQLHVDRRQIHSIYLTHFHPDHFGLAGWMQRQTGAQVWISREDYAMAERVWEERSDQSEQVGEAFRQHGVPDELVSQIEESMQKLAQHVMPLPSLSILNHDEVILGQKQWKVIEVPGHSDGLINFYQPELRYLLVSDHVLERITPNISVWPGSHPNPLKRYVSSLHRVKELDVAIAFPAHGEVIRYLRQRVDDILRHHEKRLHHMKSLASEGKTAYEVAFAVFGHKSLTAHQWRFAIAETLAHLDYLVSRGELQKEKRNGSVVYQSEEK